MVRDPHSYGNSDEVRPSHLALELTLNFTQRRIDGRCDLTLAWLQPDAAHIDLDTRDLTIMAVTDVEDHPLTYELGGSASVYGPPSSRSSSGASREGARGLSDASRCGGLAMAHAGSNDVATPALFIYPITSDSRPHVDTLHGQPRCAHDL